MYFKYITICLISAAIRRSYTFSISENVACPDCKIIHKRSAKTNFVLQKLDTYPNPRVTEFQSTIADPTAIVDDELTVQIIGKDNTRDRAQERFQWDHEKDSSKFMARPMITNRFHEDVFNSNLESRMFDASLDDNLIGGDCTRNLQEISNVPTAEDEGDGSNLFYIQLDEMISDDKKENNIIREKILKKTTEVEKNKEKKCGNNKIKDDLLDIVTVEAVTEYLIQNPPSTDSINVQNDQESILQEENGQC